MDARAKMKYATSQVTRENLITAAGELFALKGADISTRSIASRAGESLGAIHYHFGSKEMLFEEMINTILKPWKEKTVQSVIDDYEDRLDTDAGKIAAVHAVVRRYMEFIKHDDAQWHGNVVHRVLQQQGRLKDIVKKQLIDPTDEAVTSLFMRIKPELSRQDASFMCNMMFSPIILHCNMRDVTLENMEMDEFTPEYFAKLESRILGDSLNALGLPCAGFF